VVDAGPAAERGTPAGDLEASGVVLLMAVSEFALAPSVPGKRCAKCGQTWPVDDFHRSRDRSDGRAGWCKSCVKVYMASGVKRKSRLKTTYGLTAGAYDAMVDAQGGKCASCGRPPSDEDRGGRLAVDHDHRTGRVRGLLCVRCNTALGLLREDRDVITMLWKYLDAQERL
jgi:hypothetical protein